MRMRAWAAAFTFGLAWVINPAFVSGCLLPVDWQFGEREVVALVHVASESGPYRLGAADREVVVSFDLTQASSMTRVSEVESLLGRTAYACGQRTFVRSASACLDTTLVPVEGTLTVEDASGTKLLDHVHATGHLRVIGTRLTHAQLDLSAGSDGVYLVTEDAKTFSLRGAVVGGRNFAPPPPPPTRSHPVPAPR